MNLPFSCNLIHANRFGLVSRSMIVSRIPIFTSRCVSGLVPNKKKRTLLQRCPSSNLQSYPCKKRCAALWLKCFLSSPSNGLQFLSYALQQHAAKVASDLAAVQRTVAFREEKIAVLRETHIKLRVRSSQDGFGFHGSRKPPFFLRPCTALPHLNAYLFDAGA